MHSRPRAIFVAHGVEDGVAKFRRHAARLRATRDALHRNNAIVTDVDKFFEAGFITVRSRRGRR
jgi:hypothetical protein